MKRKFSAGLMTLFLLLVPCFRSARAFRDFGQLDMRGRIDSVRQMTAVELLQELQRARRIDRQGQQLLRRRVAVATLLNQAELEQAVLAGSPEVRQLKQLFSRSEVREAVAALRQLPPEQQSPQFSQWLQELVLERGLSPHAWNRYQQLERTRQDIELGRQLLEQYDQRIAAHEQGGRPRIPVGQFELTDRSAALRRLAEEAWEVDEAGLPEERGDELQLDAELIRGFLDTVLSPPVEEKTP